MAVLHFGHRHLKRLPGGVAAGPVPVEAEYDFRGQPEQALQVGAGGGGAQGGNRVIDAELGQADHVHVAFHHHAPPGLADCPAGPVQPVEFRTLVEQRCFRGVQVLGLPVPQGPPAEGHDPAAVILDGEDDAAAESVVDAAAPAIALPLLL